MILVVITEVNFQVSFFGGTQKKTIILVWSLTRAAHRSAFPIQHRWREAVQRLICWNAHIIELVGAKPRLRCEISVNLMRGLHRGASFLKTPLPFCTSWCYHNPGPRVDLLWLMASSSARTRVHRIICWEGQTLHPVKWGRGQHSNVGNRKRKWTRPGRGERMEGTEHNICPPTLFINL